MEKELLPLQLECTMLFQSNPYMIETLEGVGEKLGRKKEELISILDMLVKQGIIQQLGDETSPLFRYKEPAIFTELDMTKGLDNP